MKMTFGKNLASEKLKARARLDQTFLPRINELMGPKWLLYQGKYLAAKSDPSLPDADEIVTRFEQLLAELSALEAERQLLQAQIDACETVPQMEEIAPIRRLETVGAVGADFV